MLSSNFWFCASTATFTRVESNAEARASRSKSSFNRRSAFNFNLRIAPGVAYLTDKAISRLFTLF
jgi:hypothetical protein